LHWRAVCVICGATGPWAIARSDALNKVVKLQQSYIEGIDALRALRSAREEMRNIIAKKLDAFD